MDGWMLYDMPLCGIHLVLHFCIHIHILQDPYLTMIIHMFFQVEFITLPHLYLFIFFQVFSAHILSISPVKPVDSDEVCGESSTRFSFGLDAPIHRPWYPFGRWVSQSKLVPTYLVISSLLHVEVAQPCSNKAPSWKPLYQSHKIAPRGHSISPQCNL